jgi:methyl farnesoate epoxidase/farnesoate epoxidase
VWAHLAKKYGPVFSIKFGQMETVVVSGYDLVKQVLCHDDFDARPDKYFFRFRAFYQKLGKLNSIERSNV